MSFVESYKNWLISYLI